MVQLSSQETPGEKLDETTGSARAFTTVNKKSYEYYPWGKDNKEPHRMIGLLRSNGDIANLLETRTDFLVGAGVGLFRKVKDETEEVNFELYKDFWMDHEMDHLIEAIMTESVNLGQAYVCVTPRGKDINFSIKDGLTVRAIKAKDTESHIGQYLLSSRWDEGVGINKRAVLVPAFDFNEYAGMPASILCLKKHQTGQFYYNQPPWWALKEWIKIANRIAGRINGELDSEGNIGMILRVASKYFDQIMASKPVNENGIEYTREEVEKLFKETVDKFLFGAGKNKVLFDICGTNEKGGLEKWIEIEPIKRTITGKENNEIYLGVLTAIANSSQILGGLSGVSDGRMNSGGGTEIRESANFQQFYRTPRERKHVINFMNRVFHKYMLGRKNGSSIPQDSFFGFKNIVIETLDKNPTSNKTVKINDN